MTILFRNLILKKQLEFLECELTFFSYLVVDAFCKFHFILVKISSIFNIIFVYRSDTERIRFLILVTIIYNSGCSWSSCTVCVCMCVTESSTFAGPDHSGHEDSPCEVRPNIPWQKKRRDSVLSLLAGRRVSSWNLLENFHLCFLLLLSRQ